VLIQDDAAGQVVGVASGAASAHLWKYTEVRALTGSAPDPDWTWSFWGIRSWIRIRSWIQIRSEENEEDPHPIVHQTNIYFYNQLHF